MFPAIISLPDTSAALRNESDGVVIMFQLAPPLVVISTELLSPKAKPVDELANCCFRLKVTPELSALQFAPLLVVFKIIPPLPDIYPVRVSEKKIELGFALLLRVFLSPLNTKIGA